MIGQSIGLGFSESVHGLVKHVIKINVEAVFKTFSLHVLSKNNKIIKLSKLKHQSTYPPYPKNSISSFGSVALRDFMILEPMRSDYLELARMHTFELNALVYKLFDNII
jgi:hypothetical protein